MAPDPAPDDTVPLPPHGGDAEGPDSPPVAAGPAPWRVRDLRGSARVLAVVAAVLLVVPVAASLLRAVDQGWVPSNDEALIVLRARDVFGSDPPLVGQPSTAGQYASDHPARHPGPIEFYLLAVPVRVLGPTWGTLLTVALITGSAVLLTVWAALRRAGPVVALGAVVLVVGVMWSTGTAVLTDPISSNVGGYPLLAGSALAWALWGDDRRLWPVAVAVWSFTAQQHLAILGPAGVVAAWGVLGAAVTTVRARHEIGRSASSLRWGVAAAVVGVVCWLPPLIDQVFGDGNLAYILGFSGSEDRATLGFGAGVRAAGRALGQPPLLTRRDVDGGQLIDAYPGVGTTVGAVLGLALLVGADALAAASILRRDRSSEHPADTPGRPADSSSARLTLALTGLVLVAAGVVTTANVPESVEQIRINFYRWSWPVAVALLGSVAWVVGVLVARIRARRDDAVAATDHATDEPRGRMGPPWAVPAVVLALVAVVVGATAGGHGRMDRRRDELAFRFEADAADAVLAVIDRDRPVHLVTRGSAAFLAITPALAVALEDAGVDVRIDTTDGGGLVDRAQRDGFGPHRLELADDPGARVHVVTGVDELPDVPGEVVAELAIDVELDRLAGEVAEQLAAGPLVPSDEADDLLAAYDDVARGLLEFSLAQLGSDPDAAVRNELVVDILLAGYLASPAVDRDQLEALRREILRGAEVWGDDRFAVVVELLP